VKHKEGANIKGDERGRNPTRDQLQPFLGRKLLGGGGSKIKGMKGKSTERRIKTWTGCGRTPYYMSRPFGGETISKKKAVNEKGGCGADHILEGEKGGSFAI